MTLLRAADMALPYLGWLLLYLLARLIAKGLPVRNNQRCFVCGRPLRKHNAIEREFCETQPLPIELLDEVERQDP